MKKHRIVALMLVLLVCFVLVGPVAALDATGDLLISYQQEKEDEANEKYNVLLKKWSLNPEHYTDENCDFPDFYGGCYINENKDFVIKVTACDKEVISYFGALIDLENVSFEKVEYSLETLLEEKAALVEKIISTSAQSNAINGVGISQIENAITVEANSVSETLVKLSESDRRSFIDDLTEFENVIITYVDSATAACTDVIPGTSIGNRSVGFWATDSSGNLGIVTAPHASLSQGDTLYYYGSVFGVCQTPYFGDDLDAVFVKRTNTAMTPEVYVPGWGYEMRGSAILAVGSQIYGYGKTSGTITGTIVDPYYTSIYSGVSVSCVNTNASCQGGDSGGPVVGGTTTAYKSLLGIVISRTGAGYMNYCKAPTILSELNLRMYSE